MRKGTMKQAWLMKKGGPWEIKEVPIPIPGPGEILVKMKVASICNQTELNTVRALHPPHEHQTRGMLPHDLRIWDNRVLDELLDVYPARLYPHEPFPTLMGHEGMGEVVEIGPYVANEDYLLGITSSLKPGDRVAMINIKGGFGEYVITQHSDVIKVPDSVSDEEACLHEPVNVVFTVVRYIVQCSDTVCILGQGFLGLLSTQIAKICGASRIIVSEPNATKRELAKKFGADITIDPSTTNVVHEIEKITDGKGVNVVIEAAGEPETIRIIPYITSLGAKVGQIGACCVPVTVDWSYIHFKGLQVTSSVYLWREFNMMNSLIGDMELIASGKLDLKSLITHRYYALEDIEKAFKDVESGMVIKVMFKFE